MLLETSRLIIKPISIENKNAVFEYRSDGETNRYQGWIPKTIDDVVTFINKTAKQIDLPETWFQLVIQEKETLKIIGDIGIHFFGKENKQVEIGCTLHKNFQHKGYATESLKRVIEYLFNELDKHRIITSIDPENISSIELVKRIGFRKEAHFVESLYINGKWVDDVIFALLKKDYFNTNKPS